MNSPKYYTCDQCEWAGPFSDARTHFDETGHDSFSKRGDDDQQEVIVQPAPIIVTQYCDHQFAWWSVVPPTNCPKCGAYLGNFQPWIYPKYRHYPPWTNTAIDPEYPSITVNSSNTEIETHYG